VFNFFFPCLTRRISNNTITITNRNNTIAAAASSVKPKFIGEDLVPRGIISAASIIKYPFLAGIHDKRKGGLVL
jgi:hypothetical protein